MNTIRSRSSIAVALICMCAVFASAQAQITETIAPPASAPAASAKSVPTDTIKQASTDSLPPIDKMPVLKEFIRAEYPAEFVKKGIEGQVQLDLVVDTLGHVDSVAIVKGFNPKLDTCAAVAAKKFSFTPAMAGGVAVPVLMEYVYRFTLDEVVKKIETYVNFKGKLIEKGVRAPLSNATVVVHFPDSTKDKSLTIPFTTYLKKIGSFSGQHYEDGALVTTTDSLGQFSFYSLPSGPIAIRVISPGFQKFEESEDLKPSSVTTVKYYLERFSYGENEVVVYGKAERKEVSQHTLTLNEIKKIPGFGGDAVKVVQALPGVARAGFMSGDIVVRGGSNSDSRFYLDGVWLPVLFHFGGLKSTYNSDALESVDFYPGGFGTRYGNVTAGVVEIKGRPAQTDRIHAKVDANFYDGSLMLEGPVTKDLSLLLTGRRSFIGDIVSEVAKSYDLPFTIQPYYWDYTARADYSGIKNQKLYLTLFGSQDFMKMIMSKFRGGTPDVSDETNQLNMKSTFNMGILGWNWTVSPTITNSLTYGLNYFQQHMAMFGYMKMDEDFLFNQLRNQTSITVNPQTTVNVGLDMSAFPVNIKLIMLLDTVSRDTLKDWWFGDIAPYVNVNWKPIPQLEIIPGLRYDYYPELKHRGTVVPAYWNYSLINNKQGGPGDPSLRLTMRYKLNALHTLKGSLGNYNQTPQPIGQAIMPKWGDAYLPTTKAAQYVLGWEWKMSDLISADLQTYYNSQWNIPRTSTPADPVPSKGYLSDEKGRMYGLELMLKHDQGKHFFGWISYSLSRSERWDPHSEGWILFNKDQTHNLQFVGNYRLPRLWEIGTRIRYVTGNPNTPIIGSAYNETYGQYYPLFGPQYSSRMDPFFQVDLRIDKKIMFRNWIFSFYLDFQNLSYFVYKSPETYLYNYDYTEKVPVGGIPYPSLGLTAEF